MEQSSPAGSNLRPHAVRSDIARQIHRRSGMRCSVASGLRSPRSSSAQRQSGLARRSAISSVVRFRLPESALDAPSVTPDLDVQFAGATAHYAHVPFQQTVQGGVHHITGTVPSTVSDFKMTAPSFLTVPIKNEIPVKVDMYWQRQ